MLDAEAPPARRGRRLLIALLVLLLVLLPLYLWPLRGGVRGLPGASARPGSPTDPRNAAALARVPPEVWDALMGQGGTAPTAASSGATPRNLTMIGSLEEVGADGLGPGPSPEAPARLARAMIAALGGPPGPEGSGSGGGNSPSTPGPSGPPDGAPGTPGSPSAFGWGGYPMPGDLGPGGGGGLRLPGPGATFSPDGLGDPGAPAPTPEPATLLLVGSNVVVLGAAAWKRRRRRRETPAIG